MLYNEIYKRGNKTEIYSRLGGTHRFVAVAHTRNAYWHPARTHVMQSGAWLLEFINMATHHDSWAREKYAHHLQKLQCRGTHKRWWKLFLNHFLRGIGANWQLLTLSQRVRTCVSVNWLHSFNCSIHWSRSFVVALSSIAVVGGKVSSIFVDSILTAFFNDGGLKNVYAVSC